MENAKQHWPILRKVGTNLANKVRSFMVIGDKGDGVLLLTKDGEGYWLGKIRFGMNESNQAMEPIRLDVPNLASMAQGDSHILLLDKNGKIYSMGENNRGQLGLGTENKNPYFSSQFIPIPSKFTSIRCGKWHSLALTKDGKVWAWGSNDYGQVGMPRDTESIPSPRQIPELNPYRVVEVECGGNHSLALTDQGEVYGWGENFWGQLGDESKLLSSHTLTRIHTPSPIESMAAGLSHTLLLTQTEEVYACGYNGYGQLGLGNGTKFSPNLSKVVGLPSISQIASHPATFLSIAMTSDQRCFVWGQLADETCIFTPWEFNDGMTLSTPWKLHSFYSTVESPLSSFSIRRNTPHSVLLPG